MPFIDYSNWILTTTNDYDGELRNVLDKIIDSSTTAKKKTYAIPAIRNIYFNADTGHTVVIWEDGEKTVVRCMEGEKFEPYVGFCAAIAKRLYGSTSAAKKIMQTHNANAIAEEKRIQHENEIKARREQEAKNRERKLHSMSKRIRNMIDALTIAAKDLDLVEEIDAPSKIDVSEKEKEFKDEVERLRKILESGDSNG